ncbi:MAG: hypothetical protein J6V53_06780 [Alphaproteobacteria bacterium]|nr:hypothetical protein [Alphaproteobacteria bacterium]
MTHQDKLSILPEYDEKSGCFLGYAVKQGNQFLKDTKGKKIILSVQDNDNGSYAVSYEGQKWILSAQEYETHEEAQLKFTPKFQNGHFHGYTILQYDEKEEKLVSRGTVNAKDILYKRTNNGTVECLYEDIQADGSSKTYLVSKMSQEEYDLFMHLL